VCITGRVRGPVFPLRRKRPSPRLINVWQPAHAPSRHCTPAQVVVDAALGCMSDFSCQSTCNMLWSLATGGTKPRAALLDALASRLHGLMDGASAQQMGGGLRHAGP